MNKTIMAIGILALIILAGCSPGQGISETPAPGVLQSPIEAPESYLAQELNLPLDQINLTEMEPVQWSDACLGAPQPGELCAEVITPGYRLSLDTPEGIYQIHTDQTGESIRVIPPQGIPVTENAIVWERSGGFAGICQRLTIKTSSEFILEDCGGDQINNQGTLTSEDWIKVQDWIGEFGTFKWEALPPQGSADMFTDIYMFNGDGQEIPTGDVQANIAQFLEDLTSRLTQDSPQISGIPESGITGLILIGPTCPGPQRSGPGETECPDLPYQATVEIWNQRNQVVTTYLSDDTGRFKVLLEPGTYTLHPLSPPEMSFPRAAEQSVTVNKGQFTQVQILYDTGIR